jgi:hypothetical protein
MLRTDWRILIQLYPQAPHNLLNRDIDNIAHRLNAATEAPNGLIHRKGVP